MRPLQAESRSKVMRDFLKKVEAKMQAGGVSVAQLAELTGLSRQYIYRVLNGEHVPSLVVAEKIAKNLGLHIETVDAA